MIQYRKIPDSELTYGNNCPYIDIQCEIGRLFISNAVFRLIGKPTGIRFLWNAGKHSLLIEPTDVEDPESYPVTSTVTYKKHGSLIIGCSTMLHEMWSVLDWDKKLRFRIVAKYNEQANVAIFDMEDAIGSEIPRNIRGGRPKKAKKTKRTPTAAPADPRGVDQRLRQGRRYP